MNYDRVGRIDVIELLCAFGTSWNPMPLKTERSAQAVGKLIKRNKKEHGRERALLASLLFGVQASDSYKRLA